MIDTKIGASPYMSRIKAQKVVDHGEKMHGYGKDKLEKEGSGMINVYVVPQSHLDSLHG